MVFFCCIQVSDICYCWVVLFCVFFCGFSCILLFSLEFILVAFLQIVPLFCFLGVYFLVYRSTLVFLGVYLTVDLFSFSGWFIRCHRSFSLFALLCLFSPLAVFVHYSLFSLAFKLLSYWRRFRSLVLWLLFLWYCIIYMNPLSLSRTVYMNP